MLTLRHSLGLLALLFLRSTTFLASAAVLPRQSCGNESDSLLAFEITQDSSTPELRSLAIDTKRATFLYGPPVAGGPFYPIGPLALTKQGVDLAAVQVDEAPQLTGSTVDGAEARLESAEVRWKLLE